MIERLRFHPGEYLADIVYSVGMEDEFLSEFELNQGLKQGAIKSLMNESIGVTRRLASKLEILTGVSTETWIQLQSSYEIPGPRFHDDGIRPIVDGHKEFNHKEMSYLSNGLSHDEAVEMTRVLNRASGKAIELALALGADNSFFLSLEKTGTLCEEDPRLLGQALELFLYETEDYALPSMKKLTKGLEYVVIENNGYELNVIKEKDGTLIPLAHKKKTSVMTMDEDPFVIIFK